MRMKLNKSSQLLLAAAASLLAAGLLSACASLTVDFVYVTCAQGSGSYNYGSVDVFEINSESGRMRQIPASPFPSGGRDPVAETVSSDMTNLYVANQDDNTIVQFAIGNDGKLYPVTTVNTPGIYPLAVAFSSNNLFVLDLYQPLPSCSIAAPCSGSISVLPIITTKGVPPSEAPSTTAVSNGALTYWPLCLYGYSSPTSFTQCQTGALSADVIVPTGISVLADGSYAYVSAYDSTASPTVGYIFAFAVAPSTSSTPGALTPVNDGVPLPAGTQLTAIASDSSSSYVYATDYSSGSVFGYSVSPTTGQLSALAGGAVASGSGPSSIVVDPKYPYAYVANSQDSTVTAFSISSGVLTRIGAYATGLQPVAIGVDPSTSHFIFTANFLGANVSGFDLNSTNGTLLNSQYTPYGANAQPNAVAAVPHGVQ
jgi:6-phosphogluconolactonase (cycloisomerase 2 family)